MPGGGAEGEDTIPLFPEPRPGANTGFLFHPGRPGKGSVHTRHESPEPKSQMNDGGVEQPHFKVSNIFLRRFWWLQDLMTFRFSPCPVFLSAPPPQWRHVFQAPCPRGLSLSAQLYRVGHQVVWPGQVFRGRGRPGLG